MPVQGYCFIVVNRQSTKVVFWVTLRPPKHDLFFWGIFIPRVFWWHSLDQLHVKADDNGFGKVAGALQGLSSRWLSLMRCSSFGRSIFITSLDNLMTATVVASSVSLMPLILKQLRWPYCSRASFRAGNSRVSFLITAMVVSRSASCCFRERTSSRIVPRASGL